MGSLVGQVFHTTAAERKVLLACGAAAGMSATFNTRSRVILAIELLLFEFKVTILHSIGHCKYPGTLCTSNCWGAVQCLRSPRSTSDTKGTAFLPLLGVIAALAAVGSVMRCTGRRPFEKHTD